MSNQDYEQKKRECWEEFCRINPSLSEYIFARRIFNYAFKHAYKLGKQEKDAEETVISGWMSRDKDGLLNFFYGGSTPYKNYNDGDWNTLYGRVLECLPREIFPDLTWDDDPIKVELIIKRKNESDLEPYTELTEKNPKESDETFASDSERRLNIAATILAGIVAREAPARHPVKRALELTDALVAECKQGDNNA